ncbi:hypothetical protein JZ751_002328 [Albula glossodonta]|uniref:Rho-GAP domain-containing protein n=1 Tax=Albula glossodonta TaxID=121402 RepID=A0A8T2P9H9_9TELE|nr:hypothetical protein JZ751_002328 [Albula glossodonta]
MRHLSHLATFSYVTNMHSKNLAIVWAPNLLRSKQIESACFSGTAAFMEVRIQSVVVEFILNHVDVLFSPKLSLLIREGTGHGSLSRPKSLLVSSPSTKLLTLEEAQARTQAQINSPVTADSKYIEVGEGPAALQGKFHTIIEFPTERKRAPSKAKKSPVGSWRSFFNLGKSSSMAKRKLQRNPSEPNEIKSMALAGESKVYRPRRPRSSSDALSSSFNGELLDSRQHCNSYDNLPQGDSDGEEGPLRVPALISPPRSAEDMDLSPPDIGMASLDFDPMSFQCSLPASEPAFPSPEHRETASPHRSGSEPASPPREGQSSPAISPNLSPAPRPHRSPPTFLAEAPQPALSPKAPPLSTSEPAAADAAKEATPPASPPARSLSPSAREASDTPTSGVYERRPQSEQTRPQSEQTGPTISTTAASEGAEPTPAQPVSFCVSQGAVALDSLKVSTPVSAASLLPPPPPPKNAARMLALALAESAQQATMLSQRRASGPPTPVSPLRPPDPLEWPPEPQLQPQIQTSPSPPPAAVTESQMLANRPQITTANSMMSIPTPSASQDNNSSIHNAAASPSADAAASSAHTDQHFSPPAQVSNILQSPDRKQSAMGQSPVSTPSPVSTAREGSAVPQQDAEMQCSKGISSPTSSKSAEPSITAATPQCVSPGPTSPLSPGLTATPASHPGPAPTLIFTAPVQPVEKPWEAIKPLPPQAYSPTPPTPPVRSMESRLAAAALSGTEAANASNFHAILAEASVPASVEEVLPQPPPPPRKSSAHLSSYLYHSKAEGTMEPPPTEAYYHSRAVTTGQPYHYRPESVPPHLSWASKSDPQILYSARADARYATLGPKSFHQSFKSRGPHRGEYPPSGHRGQGYGALDGTAVYPTIRRVHSLHAPPTAIRAVPLSRAELPPEDEPHYYQRPVYQYKAVYQPPPPPPPPAQADYHVTQLQPFFENGRVQYRYSPYSGAHPLDASYYDVDPYGTIRLRHVHSFAGRNPHPPQHVHRVGGKAGGYHYVSRHVLPVGKEHSFVSRDMPPSGMAKSGPVYLAWDPEDSDRAYMHSLRRESRARLKTKGPVTSQYDNVALLDAATPEIRHLRSKSDPGKAVLMAVEGKDIRYSVAPVSQHPPRHQPSDSEVLAYADPEKRYHGNGLVDKPANKHASSRIPQHAPHQDTGRLDSKSEPLDHKQGGRQWQEHNAMRYERPTQDRQHAGKGKAPSGYPEEEPQAGFIKPERTQNMRERHHYPHPRAPHPQEGAERDPRGNHSYQSHGMWAASHYDNLDDYHPAPQPQAPLTRPGAGPFLSSVFTPSHGNRTYSTALGQGAFVKADLPLQRPEAEIHAE